MEFSKKLLIFSWVITLILTTLSICFSIMCLSMEAFEILIPLTWAETGAATAYYYWKAKNENRAKYAQKFIEEFSKEWGVDTALRIADIVLKD